MLKGQTRLRTKIGIFSAIFALFLYASSDALVKVLLTNNYPVEQVTFMRSFSRLLPLIFFMLLFHKGFSPLKTSKPSVHLANSVISIARTYAFMWSIKLIPMSEASAISYTSASFLVILSVVFLREKLQKHHILAVLMGAIGVVIAFRLNLDVFKIGALVTLSGAFLAAINKIIIRKLSFSDDSLGIIIYPNIFLLLVTLPFLFGSWQDVAAKDWIIFVAIGAMAALGQYCFALALKYTKGLTLAPYDYTYLCWITVIDYVLYSVLPNKYVIIGAIFILSSNIIILIFELKKSRNVEKH